ncbi:MAG: anti-sigma factor [Terriglobia bacterium]|jgi:hypothetical protein
MKDLENELRKALEHREPPPGFAERVLARIEPAATPKPRWREALFAFFRWPRLGWTAAPVVACLLVTLGAVHYRRAQRERAEGEAAKAQVIQALRVASRKLNVTWKKVQETDHRPPRT